MKIKFVALSAVALVVAACGNQNQSTHSPADRVLIQPPPSYYADLPHFETSPDEVKTSVQQVLQMADLRLKQIADRDPSEMTFENTVRAIDDILHPVGNAANRFNLMMNTNPSADVQQAASDAVDAINEWLVDFDYRDDLYQALMKFGQKSPDLQKTRPDLQSEDLRFYHDILLEFKRAGLALDPDSKASVRVMRKQISDLQTKFDENLRNATESVTFTKEELDGVPSYVLDRLRSKENPDEYVVKANSELIVQAILQNATNEDTRKKLTIANFSVAKDTNTKIFEEAVTLRDRVAKKLGYASWNDYQTELKMVKNGKTARDYIENLSARLQPKFDAEMALMTQKKIRDTKDPNAKIQIWDFRYYMNALMKEDYNVDQQKIRRFFTMSKVIQGAFQTYETLFGIKLAEVAAPYAWVPELKLFSVTDLETNRVLGYLYLDLFPRQGKYNHFAEFGITDGKMLGDGTYVKPVVSLVCNFNPGSATEPALQSHDDVVTFFHEFGHAMHAILTRAHYRAYSGTSVQADFVEAPSQMLENWPWDKRVLDLFAADYETGEKISDDLLAKMKAADLATQGTYYRRQFALALLDLNMHDAGENKDSAQVTADAFAKTFLPVPPGTNFVASFGHLMDGYDSGYYGYAWSKGIAQDMFTVFQSAPGGLMDVNIGRRLRKEIYEVGGTRDADDSVRAFLGGRGWSVDPFVKFLGITTKPGSVTAPVLKN